MTEPDSLHTTCWTLIHGACAGSEADRESFAGRYLGVVRAYLANRWQRTAMLSELDDAVQEVFVECFRQGGVLDRVQDRPPASFRAFLYGVARNVALRWERRASTRRGVHAPVEIDPERVESDGPTLSRVFDRSWARSLFRQAAEVQRERARASGDAARRRVELLELRSRDGLPIRSIAERWGADAAALHKEYARARREFRAALGEVITFHYPGLTEAEVDAKGRELIGLLQ